jgi:hypothetical protein
MICYGHIWPPLNVYADSYKFLHCVQYFMGVQDVQVRKCVLVKETVGYFFKIISKLCVICPFFLFLSLLSWLGYVFSSNVLVFCAVMVGWCVCVSMKKQTK